MKQRLLDVLKAPSRAMRRLYDWTIGWSQKKKAPYALFSIAFAESSFFPVPPDALLIPMVIANRMRWLFLALLTTMGSVLGALLGYFIGWGLYESVGKPIVDFYGLQAKMELVAEKYAEHAFLAILTAAFTPIPYKVFTISAGLFHISLPILVFASILGRGARFFIVAALLRIYGRRISDTLEKYFDVFALAFMVLLIGGFIVVRYLL
jgi:membrane protein YqaA with SNARE-associated domain